MLQKWKWAKMLSNNDSRFNWWMCLTHTNTHSQPHTMRLPHQPNKKITTLLTATTIQMMRTMIIPTKTNVRTLTSCTTIQFAIFRRFFFDNARKLLTCTLYNCLVAFNNRHHSQWYRFHFFSTGVKNSIRFNVILMEKSIYLGAFGQSLAVWTILKLSFTEFHYSPVQVAVLNV